LIVQETKVLDHGYVRLIDTMGDDLAIVNAARVSYDGKGKSTDERLIRRLMKDRHTSPFEMVEYKFEIKLPIFVMRQWVRHRTASLNEISARYSVLPNEFHVPELEALYPQSMTNKQGRDVEAWYTDAEKRFMQRKIRDAGRHAYDDYEDLLDEYNLTRELARGVLPVNIYTKCVWKLDLHNLLHFLKLRTDKHAQAEIRAYAEAIEAMVAEHVPMTYRAWVNYQKEAVTLSRDEADLIKFLLKFYIVDLPAMGDDPERVNANDGLMGIDAWARSVLTESEMLAFNERFLPNDE
jgi:thymidylate synthase (FAD)